MVIVGLRSLVSIVRVKLGYVIAIIKCSNTGNKSEQCRSQNSEFASCDKSSLYYIKVGTRLDNSDVTEKKCCKYICRLLYDMRFTKFILVFGWNSLSSS